MTDASKVKILVDLKKKKIHNSPQSPLIIFNQLFFFFFVFLVKGVPKFEKAYSRASCNIHPHYKNDGTAEARCRPSEKELA